MCVCVCVCVCCICTYVREVHGINHPDTINSAENLMELLKQQGRIDEANGLKLKYNIQISE